MRGLDFVVITCNPRDYRQPSKTFDSIEQI